MIDDFIDSKLAEFEMDIAYNATWKKIEWLRQFSKDIQKEVSTSLLQKMEKKKTKVDTFAGWTIHHDEGYNEGVSDCIAIVKEI